MHIVEARPDAAPSVTATHRPDGSILLTSDIELPPVEGTIVDRLAYWAAKTPDAPFLSHNERVLNYAEANTLVHRSAAHLLALCPDRDQPIMLVAENGIDHALIVLASMTIGLPVAVIASAYTAPSAAPYSKFNHALGQITPLMVVADHPETTRTALAAIGRDYPVHDLHDLRWLTGTPPAPSADLEAARASVTLDSVAKLLLTSGSTGTPKAVRNTQRMMVSNMLALSKIWPFLGERPPRMVDWLPWNHTFGGNCCFHINLWFGGHLLIDNGRPTAALVHKTVEAIRTHRPNIFFNVPIGYDLLLPFLEEDPELARAFLGGLEFMFNAGAALPDATRRRLEAVFRKATGREPPIVGAWGSTETAPFSTVLHFPTPHAANLGLPIPGTTIKLVPDDGNTRYELRVRGPNVTPGYWYDEASTQAAFDEEGFYRIGDAGKFADPDRPERGILFDGRIAENFKLTSGTFVNVGALRVAIISAGEKLIRDVVVAGEGRSELGLLVFHNETACKALVGDTGGEPMHEHPALLERLAAVLRAYNGTVKGSSLRIARFLVADHPPSAAHDEITEKGYINQRRVLSRRKDDVERIYREGIALL